MPRSQAQQESTKKFLEAGTRLTRTTREKRFLKVGKAEARAAGQVAYWDGVACNHGHIDFKYLTGGCIKCNYINQKKRKGKLSGSSKMVEIDRLLESINDKDSLENFKP